MYFLYNILYIIYLIIYLPYLILTNRYFAGLGMRFGNIPLSIQHKIKAKKNLWLHAVSVGEVMVLDVFAGELKKRYPDEQIVITVTTKTGYLLAS